MGFLKYKQQNEVKEITLDTILCQNKDIDASDLDGEKVMMNLEKGQYYMMNEVASSVWELIEEPITISEVIDTLLGEYEVDKDTCTEAVLSFINEVKETDLIIIK